MNKNEIIKGDALEELKNLPDESVDMILTDPPYSTPVITAFGRKKQRNLADLSMQESFFSNLKEIIERILKEDGRLLIFCNDNFYPILFSVFYDWNGSGLIVWDKGRIGMGKPIRKKHELIFYANRGSWDWNQEIESHCPSIIEAKPVRGKEKRHGAQKPVKLLKRLIVGMSDKDDLVLDPFVGSGSTCIAAKGAGRDYLGIELNPDYIEIAQDRLAQQKLL